MKLKFSILFFIPFFVFFTTKLKAQNPKFHNFYYRLYTVEHGLSTSSIFSLFQDKKGDLWIGTIGGGINIYNGVSFKNISKENGLVGKSVYSIIQDRKGTMWIGTDKGVSKIEGKKITNYTTEQGLPDNIVWKIFEDHTGKIWAGTGKGLAVFDKNKFETFITKSNLDNLYISTIFEDSDNNMWFGTKTQGAFKIKGKNITQYSTINKLSNNWVFNINQDNYKNIFIGTSIGLNIIKDSVISIPYSSSFTCSSKLLSGKFIFSTYSGRINTLIENNSNLNVLYDTPEYNYRTCIVDKEGSIWIGTETGLIQIPPSPFINWNNAQNLTYNNVYAISKGFNPFELWIGCIKGSAYYFREKNVDLRFYNYPSIKIIEKKLKDEKKITPKKLKEIIKKNINSSTVYSIVKDNKNRTWFGTISGISIFNAIDRSFIHITNDTIEKKYYCIINKKLQNKGINYLTKDVNGNIWCGTQSGVNVFSDTTIIDNNTELKKLDNIPIYHIFQDNRRNIWFSTQQGLFYYNGKILTHLIQNKTFEEGQINSVIQDNKNNYWIATKEGVYFYNLKEVEKIDKSKGLISDNIYSLTTDKTSNYIFIGTNQGLDKLNLNTFYSSKKIEIRHYGKYEGFLGLDCNRNANYKDSIGRIWFGTVDGITMYNPELDKINTVKPITYITNILYNFQEFDWSQYSSGTDTINGLPIDLVLPYNINHITFQYSANSLTAPEKVRYKYMMQGVDDNWSPPMPKNEFDFPTLSPGKYTFKIKACNNDGLWNEVPTTFSFEISPPWYLTWYAIVSFVIIILILIFIYIKYREASLRRDKFRLEKTVKERTVEVVKQKEIVEQKNKDITDSINYAKNIQEAVLPTKEEITKHFPESFLLYKPRDIVSGDFYWISYRNNKTYFAIADCTGHGVPGAFMSMLGIAFLDEIIGIYDSISANNMLNQLRENVILSLRQTGKEGEAKDGMDISLIIFDNEKQEIEFAGANNPIYIVSSSQSAVSSMQSAVGNEMHELPTATASCQLYELKGDNMPIGVHIKQQPFNSQTVKINNGDSIYMFSDGYADQFGGPKGKKFKYKQLKELLLKINGLPMQEQKLILNNTILDWRGKNPQIDDIILSGIYFGKETLKIKNNKQ